MKTRKSYVKHVGNVSFQSYESQKAANEQAEKHIAAAYTDSASCFAPELIIYRGWSVLIWRNLEGYAVKLERNPGMNAEYHVNTTQYRNCSTEYPTYHAARASALLQLAECTWKESDEHESEVLRGPFHAAPAYDNIREDFTRWTTFQIRYKHFARLGYAGHTCHAMARDERVPVNEDDLKPITAALLEKADDQTRELYRRGVICWDEMQARSDAHAQQEPQSIAA